MTVRKGIRFLSAVMVGFLAMAPLPAKSEGGPPMMSVMVSPQAPVTGLGRLSGEGLGVSLQGWYSSRDTLRSGTGNVGNPDKEKTRNRRSTLLLDYKVNRDWTGVVAVPLIYNYSSYTGATQKVNKVGDVTVYGKYSLYRDQLVLPTREFSAILGLDLSTGSTNARDANGVILSATQQPGSGTSDFIVSGSGVWTLPAYTLYGDASMKINREAAYQFGNTFVANLGVNYPMQNSTRLSLTGEINYQYADQDKSRTAGPAVQAGGIVRNSGGQTIYVTPGIQLAMSSNVFFNLGYQIPVHQNLHGTQLKSDGNVNIGVYTRFGGMPHE